MTKCQTCGKLFPMGGECLDCESDKFVDRLKRCLDHMDENNEIEIIMDREGLEECIAALSLRDQIATLTAERDEARKEVESERSYSLSMKSLADECSRNQQRQIETLTAELAALRSAPGMAEVDALRLEVFEWLRVTQRNVSPSTASDCRDLQDAIGKFADIARRSIASREEAEEAAKEAIDTFSEEFRHMKKENEEVVGLLDHILSCIITVKQENTPEWMEWIVEEVNKVNEAIGDPDRAELIRGRILLVKSESEAVEET